MKWELVKEKNENSCVHVSNNSIGMQKCSTENIFDFLNKEKNLSSLLEILRITPNQHHIKAISFDNP